MKRIVTIAGLAACLGLLAWTQAAQPPVRTPAATPAPPPAAAAAVASGSQGIRIGYVDLDRIAETSQVVRSRVTSVESALAAKQEDFKKKVDERNELRSRLAKQESVLTPAESERMKARLRQLEDEIDFLRYEGRKILSNTSSEVIEPVLDDILAAVERVAQANKIDLVLRGDLVLFASERVNLTSLVIREIDRTAGAAGATTVSPANPAPGRAAAPTPRVTPLVREK